MTHTHLSIRGNKFLINDALVYDEIKTCCEQMKGTLMNARFIQGVFDTDSRSRFNRYGKIFDPQRNTEELIAALPQWYAKGLRAITVGLQGGGNCFTIPGQDLECNPFSSDGKQINPEYLQRLDRLIKACDELGMIVIVSCFYCHNVVYLNDTQAIIEAVKAVCAHIRDQGYTNVILEIANEHNLRPFSDKPIIQTPQGIVALIEIAHTCAPGLPVGCSASGGTINEEVCRASDVVLLHGNGQSRSQLYNLIRKAMLFTPDKPILINEDSQALGQLAVCHELGISWGYYNNMTKQEVPADWGITEGEDRFFAWRLADMLGIGQDPIPVQDQYYFQGFEPHMHSNGMRFPRVASLWPETINFVRFYRNGELFYVCYDESFTVGFHSNWKQFGVQTEDGENWTAEVVLRSGETICLNHVVKNL